MPPDPLEGNIEYARNLSDFSSHTPPSVTARFFYTSPLAIDDPLSPIPPPVASVQAGSSYYKTQPPRPFSQFDNDALEKEWDRVRERKRTKAASVAEEAAKSQTSKSAVQPLKIPLTAGGRLRANSQAADVSGSLPSGSLDAGESSLTKTPFIRAPSRSSDRAASRSTSVRPTARPLDSYDWGEDTFSSERAPEMQSRNVSKSRQTKIPEETLEDPDAKVPVGVSRLHNVTFPNMQMVPIYWSPVRDIAPVIRATWFYYDTLLPVESEVANLLEAGYISLGAWTETWKDEINSAIEAGALGESKLVHKLWPDKADIVTSKPTYTEPIQGGSVMEEETVDPEKERRELMATVGNMIDKATGLNGPDNKASGSSPYGKDGVPRLYKTAGVIYANEKDAYILKPSLLPSNYYGRRPVANFIRRGRPIGIRVVRGFNPRIWKKLHPEEKSLLAKQANEGVSSAEAGASQSSRMLHDPTLMESERPEVTDLLLVVHGIGQKLSERVESYHFTHSINNFRREVNVILGDDSVKPSLRKDVGGIMVLPVNWRLTLSFEDGGYRDEFNDAITNEYSLADITPDTLPSVRNIVSDVMLDIPYYLTTGYHDKMVAAVVREANRIYHLWCINNPGFSRHGRVHLLAHSLGSVMAVDILSNQPTHLNFGNVSNMSLEELPQDHFAFNVHNLYMAGSPAGFFLLLKRVGLKPRRGRNKPGSEEYAAEGDNLPGVVGDCGEYGCLPVDNLYNVVNPYDPVAYCLNAAIDANYAAALKQAWVPSAIRSWLTFPSFRSTSTVATDRSLTLQNQDSTQSVKTAPPSILSAVTARLPSTVELETHNFTREEIAERKAYLLNDNGQIDYFLKYGGGPLEIQYLTMLGAHSSYWMSQDFIRMVVTEIGRPEGRDGCLLGMRAQKKKKIVV